MEDASPLLTTRGLRIASNLGGREHTIVSSLELAVEPGETIGIVGESGSGKSMTARALVGLLPRGVSAEGEVLFAGSDLLSMSPRELAKRRGRDLCLILQDPFTSLNPVIPCGRHIEEMLDKGGRSASRRHRQAEVLRRLAEVGISDPAVARRYPFQLSGGMRQRVAIAAALARDPRLLIADEPTTALDVTTQKEILELLKSMQQGRGMALILITHDLRVAFSTCDRIYVLYAGALLETGPASSIEAEPLHPYTLGLLLSEPSIDRRVSALKAIEGSVPSADEMEGQCTFAPRCRWASEICVSGAPPLVETTPRRASACVRRSEIKDEMAELRAEVERREHVLGRPGRSKLLLQATNLTKEFRSGGTIVSALTSVSLEVEQGESVGLVGESGSGKTTLARCFVGLEKPTSGALWIEGIDASDYAALSRHDRAGLRRTVQMIFQDPYSSLNPVRTIAATLKEAVTARKPRTRNADARVRDLLRLVGLPESYGPRKPVALSGGERQRVAIARALAVEPKLIVCDEPVSALDASVQAQVLNLFASLREELGVSYLFITHDLAVVRQVVERVYVLYRGAIVEAGPVDDVLDRSSHEYTRHLVGSVPRSAGIGPRP
jgi:peptide/nickel transport system ATP-binding protein